MKDLKEYFVYILECEGGSLYTGITTDIERRLSEHLGKDIGKGATGSARISKGGNYTRANQPIGVVYKEKLLGRSLASKREAEIKKMSRSQKLDLISQK
jgi:putative endonuclease